TSALPTSSAATRSMISGSSAWTCIAIASSDPDLEAATRRSCRETANLILVLEVHATAHSTAPGARLWDGLDRPSEHDVNGWARTQFDRYGRRREQVCLAELPVIWYGAFRNTPGRLILLREPDSPQRGLLALFTTDTTAGAAEIIGRYAARWSIEVAIFDAKQ